MSPQSRCKGAGRSKGSHQSLRPNTLRCSKRLIRMAQGARWWGKFRLDRLESRHAAVERHDTRFAWYGDCLKLDCTLHIGMLYDLIPTSYQQKSESRRQNDRRKHAVDTKQWHGTYSDDWHQIFMIFGYWWPYRDLRRKIHWSYAILNNWPNSPCSVTVNGTMTHFFIACLQSSRLVCMINDQWSCRQR